MNLKVKNLSTIIILCVIVFKLKEYKFYNSNKKIIDKIENSLNLNFKLLYFKLLQISKEKYKKNLVLLKMNSYLYIMI